MLSGIKALSEIEARVTAIGVAAAAAATQRLAEQLREHLPEVAVTVGDGAAGDGAAGDGAASDGAKDDGVIAISAAGLHQRAIDDARFWWIGSLVR